jgi:hypothetical protein
MPAGPAADSTAIPVEFHDSPTKAAPAASPEVPPPPPVGPPSLPPPAGIPADLGGGAPSAGCSGGLAGAGHDDRGPRVWTKAEYILWKVRGASLPAVFGTVPDRFAGPGSVELPAGAISPTFGGGSVSQGGQSGVRVGLGFDLGDDSDWGAEVSYFQLERGVRRFSQTTNASGSPVLGPVFDDPVVGRQTIIFFSEPGVATAGADAELLNRLWGAEANLRRRLPTVFSTRNDLLVGYRHVNYDESLDSSAVSTLISNQPDPAKVVSYQDHLGVHNNFDGAQVGLDSVFECGRLYLNFVGKFGIGNVHESTRVNGSTQFVSTDPTTPSQTFVGGIFAQRTNIGQQERNRFSFLGEITVNAGLHLGEHSKVFVGYNFLGLSKVARVGDTIDGVDARQVPSLIGADRNAMATRPEPRIDDGRFWAQGLNVGLEFDY